MINVTIAGHEYALGDLSFSEENIQLFESLLAIGGEDFDPSKLPIGSFRRALKESIASGSGPEKAEEAIAALKFSFAKDSDLIRAFEALGKSLGGG